MVPSLPTLLNRLIKKLLMISSKNDFESKENLVFTAIDHTLCGEIATNKRINYKNVNEVFFVILLIEHSG